MNLARVPLLPSMQHEAPKPSGLGIAIAPVSLVSMPLLSRAKRRVARGLASGALAADAVGLIWRRDSDGAPLSRRVSRRSWEKSVALLNALPSHFT